MDDSKSNPINGDEDENFSDALDEFPFYDALANFESDSSSISELRPIEDNPNISIKSKHTRESTSPANLRRRRYFSQRSRRDISRINSNSESSASFDPRDVSSAFTTDTTIPTERNYTFSSDLKDNEKESENLGSSMVRLSLGSVDKRLMEQSKGNSTITTANDARVVDFDSNTVNSHNSNPSFLFTLAGLVIKAIGFQINLLVSFFTFPVWFMYYSYMFVIDPFGIVRRTRAYLLQKVLKLGGFVYDGVKLCIYGWLRKHESTWKLALRLGWGFLWSAYVCFILVSLLVSAFVVSGIIMKNTVDEPIQMKEELNFDYTRDSPVAFVPITSCPQLSCVDCSEKTEHGNTGGLRVIPPNHKLQVTVSLTLPESDYNRNLGMFQVRVDFLSSTGKALASLRQPCMLQYKSQPIRLLLTFFKLAPLITGYSSESQTLNIKFRGYTERDVHTSCLGVIMEQRAEFSAGAGVPEIYAASLNLESELPLLKRILWSWKGTIFVWTSIMMFTMELLFTLLCFTPIIFPWTRPRVGSPDSSVSRNVRAAQS